MVVLPTVFVLIKCEDGADDKIMESLDKTDTRWDIQPTIGHYDMIAKITSPVIEHLNDTIEEIRGNDKVRSTKVLLRLADTVEAA